MGDDGFTGIFIRFCHYGGFLNFWVQKKGRLNLKQIDPIAAGFDDIVYAIRDGKKRIRILPFGTAWWRRPSGGDEKGATTGVRVGR